MAPNPKSVIAPSATSVPNLLMRHVGESAKTAPAIVKLQESVAQVTIQTQLSGASMLHLTLIDPYWEILSSGMLDVNADGLLEEIEVNFPEGSNSWWRLTMVDISSDLSSANLTLTFEDRIVAYLRSKWGPKVIKPGSTTRAQFVKQLVDEVGMNDKLQKIRFVCPSLNVVLPIDVLTGAQVPTDTPGPAQQYGVPGSPFAGPPTPDSAATNAAAQKVNKARGVPAGTTFKIKGVDANPNQIKEANTLLGVANALKAGTLATQALLCAGIGESNMGGDPSVYLPNSAGYWGVLQGGSGQKGSAPNFPDPHDTVGLATAFLKGGKGFNQGGGIALSLRTPPLSAGDIATRVETSGAAPDFYGRYLAEANAIIAAGGGVVPGSQVNASTIGTTAMVSDVAQLSRGGALHPDEDSWDCINRLAQEVNFFAFSNADTLYYMDGPDLNGQKPSLILTLTSSPTGTAWLTADGYTGVESIDAVAHIHGTFDNSSFTYRSGKPVKGQTKRKTRIAKPTTPSEIKLDLVCDITDYRAGDLFKITGAGPLNGRWIVSDATRNVFTDTYTQFTLVPPTAPLPEPSVAAPVSPATPGATPGTNPTGIGAVISAAAGTGTLAGVAAQAQLALADRGKYQYSEGSNRGNNGTLFGPAPRTMDCSAFATLCYKAAGLPDPNGFAYKTIGYTGSFITKCRKVSTPVPGDVIFFGSSESATTHMTVYVGNGSSISMGKQGDPHLQTPATVGPSAFLGYYRPKGIA
jgi:cell wall-associated NlpC family hydrolase